MRVILNLLSHHRGRRVIDTLHQCALTVLVKGFTFLDAWGWGVPIFLNFCKILLSTKIVWSCARYFFMYFTTLKLPIQTSLFCCDYAHSFRENVAHPSGGEGGGR